MMKARQVLFPAVLVAGLMAIVTSAQTSGPTFYTGTLAGANERPNPVQSSATGRVTAVLDGTTLVVGGSFSGLSGPATASHIHGPAGKDAAAGVLFPLAVSAAANGVVGAAVQLNADQVRQLAAGQYYVNIHTAANPGGELRAQLEVRAAGGAAAGGTAAAAPPACPATIMIRNGSFDTPLCSVKAGTTVKWTNTGTVDHTATSSAGAPEAFDTGLLKPGESGSFTFTKAGTYPYVCTPHAANMKGTIVVQ
jgi:plastocyanin